MLYGVELKLVQEKQANELSDFFSIPKGGSSQEQTRERPETRVH